MLENVVLGRRGGARCSGRRWPRRARELKRLEEEYELEVDPDAVVGELSVGLQQRVEILKALYRECDILILDEPTGVLTPAEADHLFRILEHLKAEGKTIILITHKLREIMAVTDAVSVMRRGEMVRTPRDRARQPGGARRGDGRAAGAAARREGAGDAGARRCSRSRGCRLVDEQGRGAAEVGRASRCAPARSSGWPGWPGNGQSELLEVLAGIRPATGGSGALQGRSRCRSAASPTPTTAATPGSPIFPRTGIGAGWSCRSPSGRARASATSTRIGSRVRSLTLDRTAIRDLRAGVDREVRRAAAVVRPEDRELLGRQPAEDRASRARWSASRTCCWSASRRAGSTSARSSSSTSRSWRCATGARRSCWSRSSSTRSRRCRDRIIVMFDGRISGERVPGATDERELGLLMAGIDPGAKAA